MVLGAVGNNALINQYGTSNEKSKGKTFIDKEGNNMSFSEIARKYIETNQVTAQELREDKDWRDMTEDEWSKMVENVDDYIEAAKERLKQMKEQQDRAAQKAALEADADMRSLAASAAAVHVAANGFEGVTEEAEAEESEEAVKNPDEADFKLSKDWTKNLTTNDPAILRAAKAAQDMAAMAMSKFQELQSEASEADNATQVETAVASVKKERENKNEN